MNDENDPIRKFLKTNSTNDKDIHWITEHKRTKSTQSKEFLTSWRNNRVFV